MYITFPSPVVVLLEVFYFVLIIVVMLGNTLIVEAIRRHSRLRTIPNICITSLAVADLLIGLINIPMYMFAIYDQTKITLLYRKVQNALDIYFGVTSILHLTFISMERCYAITFPLKRRFLRKATVAKILVALWIISIIPVCVNLSGFYSSRAILTVLFFLVPLLVVITSYIILGISVKLSQKKMEGHRTQQKKKEVKLARTLFIVITFFVIGWSPFFIVLIASNYPEFFPVKLEESGLYLFAYFVKCLHYSNSAVNPFVYAFRQREFADAFKHLFGRSKSWKHFSHSDIRVYTSRSILKPTNVTLLRPVSTEVEMLVMAKKKSGQLFTTQVRKSKTNFNSLLAV